LYIRYYINIQGTSMYVLLVYFHLVIDKALNEHCKAQSVFFVLWWIKLKTVFFMPTTVTDVGAPGI
jgi:hypothetical protein